MAATLEEATAAVAELKDRHAEMARMQWDVRVAVVNYTFAHEQIGRQLLAVRQTHEVLGRTIRQLEEHIWRLEEHIRGLHAGGQ